jgi:hypothetical protein
LWKARFVAFGFLDSAELVAAVAGERLPSSHCSGGCTMPSPQVVSTPVTVAANEGHWVGVGASRSPVALNPAGPAVAASTLKGPAQLKNVRLTMGSPSWTVRADWSTVPTRPPSRKVALRWTSSSEVVWSMRPEMTGVHVERASQGDAGSDGAAAAARAGRGLANRHRSG